MQPDFEGASQIPGLPAGGYRPSDPREHPIIAMIERIAEPIAEWIFIFMGPLFWLVIILGFLAVTLGIIPNK